MAAASLLPTLPVFLLLLLTVSRPTSASSDYIAGPLIDSRRSRFILRPAASNAPRAACPDRPLCRTIVREFNIVAAALRAERKAIRALVVGITRGSGDSGALLPRLVAEEEALTASKAGVKERALREGCGACGKLTREGDGIISPGKLFMRECGKLSRIMRIVERRLIVLEKKRNRVERLLSTVANRDRRERLAEILEQLKESERELDVRGEDAIAKSMALGCGKGSRTD